MASLRLGAQALETLAADQEPVLWPERFDVSVTVGDVNYGVSAGDSYHPRPDAYVGPPTAQTGLFWNAPFGALRYSSPATNVAAITDLFNQGQEHLT